jgi:hypothetical protein
MTLFGVRRAILPLERDRKQAEAEKDESFFRPPGNFLEWKCAGSEFIG